MNMTNMTNMTDTYNEVKSEEQAKSEHEHQTKGFLRTGSNSGKLFYKILNS